MELVEVVLPADLFPAGAHQPAPTGVNTGMTTPISLADCPGLIDLMLTADERGPHFTLSGQPCSVRRVDDIAVLEVLNGDFGFGLIVPGWDAGEHGHPAYIVVAGEAHLCMQWLPIDRAEKKVIIAQLPLSPSDRLLCNLSI